MAMNTYSETSFTCDIPWCEARSDGAADEAAARVQAAAEGWISQPGLDLCAKHHAVMVGEISRDA
ncbi:hypothetical protein [Glutamicibacter sp. NPDC087673]|uniref:hypothetical protein n=1 Tax=Glutamicibacter sp. NPDC087673 TaxID=3363997 RepID=UPI0038097BB9